MAACKQNVFALLQEESHVFRKKEKKERAERRRALRQAEKVVNEDLSPKTIVQEPSKIDITVATMKWSEVDDDDDDDDVVQYHPNQPVISEEDECSDFEVEEIEEEDKAESANFPSLKMQSEEFTNISSEEDAADVACNDISQSEQKKMLSKKERQQKELQDLGALLSDFGLNAKPNQAQENKSESISILTSVQSSDTVDQSKGNLKAKKKKKKGDTEASSNKQSGSNGADNVSDKEEQLLTREQALDAARKAASKKILKNKIMPLTDSVKLEAKKCAELLKAKKKKNKFMFEH